MSSGGEFYAIPVDGMLTQLSYDGEELKTYPGTEQFYGLYAHEDYIYAYDGSQHKFVRLDLESGAIVAIGDEIFPNEIKNLVVVRDTLYALLVLPCEEEDGHDHGHAFSISEDGYMGFEEQLYAINIKSGKTTNTGINHIMAIYAGTNGILYYYAYIDNDYGLYSYEKNRSKKIAEMDDTGYLFMFVYENDQFIYLAGRDSSVYIRDMPNGQSLSVYEDFLILTGNEMKFYAGKVLLLRSQIDASAHNIVANELFVFNIENPFESQLVNNTYQPEAITFCANYDSVANQLFNIPMIRNESNITATWVNAPNGFTEQLAQIMAGDPDVDIYVYGSASPQTIAMRDMGMYVPLNDSAGINDYLDQCFDYVSEAAHTKTGDIWMIPLSTYTMVLWYVPENFEKIGLAPEDIKYFDGFINAVKRINREHKDYAAYVDFPVPLEYELKRQYDITYNNFSEKKVNYNTELFINHFTTMWDGWRVEENGQHPLFRNSLSERARNVITDAMPNYNKSKVAFKYDAIRIHMTGTNNPLDGWRALPIPRISEDVQFNGIDRCIFAVVNPLSRNKEAAIRFLETVTQDPFTMLSNTHFFLYKDQEAYSDMYDISLPGFKDLHSIFQNGIIHIDSAYPLENYNYVIDYQAGRLTAEEAIMTLQREVEMWLNE
jgi:ABC-type glycerol-3-phosphate transport system substrate-binding protein